MHVIILNLHYGADLSSPESLLERYFLLTGWADGVRRAGVRVSVVQRFSSSAVLECNDVCYHFVADAHGPRLRMWQPALPSIRRVRALCRERDNECEQTIIHINGLLFPLQTRLMRLLAPNNTAIALQHHAERPRRGWRQRVERWGCAAADGFLFTNSELAQEWFDAGTIAPTARIYDVMEVSSTLTHQTRSVARAITQMQGDPILLWTGNLTPNKDPLTVLCGFEQVLRHAPAARLYMAYQRTDLLPQVQQAIAQSPTLTETVTLLGTIPYADIAVYYSSADLFVQGSASESGGIALLDALACGIVPVVTGIPAFRTITNDRRIGALWPVGDADAFAQAVLNVISQPLEPMAQEARRFFANHWSFAAIGTQAVATYANILQQRNGTGSRA